MRQIASGQIRQVIDAEWRVVPRWRWERRTYGLGTVLRLLIASGIVGAQWTNTISQASVTVPLGSVLVLLAALPVRLVHR